MYKVISNERIFFINNIEGILLDENCNIAPMVNGYLVTFKNSKETWSLVKMDFN